MNYGINGSGFFENMTPEAERLFLELIEKGTEITLRIPGGAISRFTAPSFNTGGWGITTEKVNKFYETFNNLQSDEDDTSEDKQKWLNRVTNQPNHSYFADLLNLHHKIKELGGKLKVIWVTNILNSTIEEQATAIRWLFNNDINVHAIEIGNEVYGKYDFDPEKYISDYLQFRGVILSEFSQAKFSIVAGNFSRNDHIHWNTTLKDGLYDNEYDFVTMHYYLTEAKLPEPFKSLPTEKLSVIADNPSLASAADYLADDVNIGTALFQEINKLYGLFNKPILITEFSSKPSSAFGNMLVHGAWLQKQMTGMTLNIAVDTICIHNGIAPDIFGIISKKRKQDAVDTDMVKRIGWYTLKFALLPNTINGKFNIPKYVYNLRDTSNSLYVENIFNTSYTGHEITGYSFYYVTGNSLFDSPGYIAHMNNTVEPSYNINGMASLSMNANTGHFELPPFSYGVIIQHFEKVENDIPIIDDDDNMDDDGSYDDIPIIDIPTEQDKPWKRSWRKFIKKFF